MDREDALRRIKKCMALSKSANDNEASVALRQAQSLMRTYDVTELDVAAADIAAEGVKSLTATRNSAGWEMRLARLLSKAFGLEHYLQRGAFYAPRGGERILILAEWVYIGPSARVAMACYTHQVLGLTARALTPARTPTYTSRCRA